MAPAKKPWKHAAIAQEIREIIAEDDWNDSYGKKRIWEALLLKHPNDDLPSMTTIYRIMTKMGLTHKTRRKPNGITKADKNARKSDDLLKRDFLADTPYTKCITDMTEIPVKGGKLYVSAIF
ncbi:MAG: IS3 family transposase, partial [Selenomonas sp.]|nr:IS3 family transposase [Selenomonas sp.]